MKKNLLYAACLMGVVALTACDNEMDGDVAAGNGQWTVEASMDMGSRTALKEDNETVVWSEGDEIYLFGGTSEATMTLDKGVEETKGEFVGNVEGKIADLKNALYPVPEVEDGKYTFELPTTRDYSENSAAPMIGTLDKNHVKFENLMALVRIPLKELEAKENVVTLTMLGGSIAGTATVDIDNKTLEVGGPVNEVVVTIPSGVTECNVDIPVPTGTYTGYIVTLNNVYKYYVIKTNELKVDDVLIADNDGTDTEIPVVTNAEDLAKEVANGEKNIILAPGEYDVYGCGSKTLTLNGTKDVVLTLMNEGESGHDYAFDGSTVTFNGITIDTEKNTGDNKGFARMTGIYNNCAVIGAYCSSIYTHVFNNCIFDTRNGYFWTWSASEVTFNGCEFGTNSKAILAHGGVATIININNCRFNAKEKGFANKNTIWTAAVEIDPTKTNTYTINFMGVNTKTEFYSAWTRIKDGSTGHIINGI